MNRVRILVAEDQAILRSGLRIILERFEDLEIVGESHDGVDALERVFELKPNVVLMDILMPQMDGIEATKEIKRRFPDVKVIIFTMYSRNDDVFGALSAGADGYCMKDVEPEALYRAIKAVSLGASWLDPAIAERVLKAALESNERNVLQPDLPAKTSRPRFDLTDRELQVLSGIVDGLSNQEIADRLFLSAETVKTHIRRIMQKLGVADRTQAAVKALKEDIL
ncbi:MAG: response regulator transcription factor [Candidatus Obscuribacterales bacterium]|nr:response regulator transcription factor [Candidatus Obscuribacterales bacterium]